MKSVFPRYFPILLSFVAAAGLFWSSTAAAYDRPRSHDEGLLLRLSGGMGWAKTSIDDAFDEVEIDGGSGDFNFALGGIVSPNLALHGTLWGWSTSDPDVELNGQNGELNGDLSLTAVGGGLTYYMMPSNLYFSASVGAAWLTVDTGTDEATDSGLALDLTLGKEWWVGRSWGLGIAGALGLHSVEDDFSDENWTGTSLGVRFTATMN